MLMEAQGRTPRLTADFASNRISLALKPQFVDNLTPTNDFDPDSPIVGLSPRMKFALGAERVDILPHLIPKPEIVAPWEPRNGPEIRTKLAKKRGGKHGYELLGLR